LTCLMPTPGEIIAALLIQEVTAHGAVRPPWVFLPGVHPFDVTWRMGRGETHLMRWGRWREGRARSEIVGAISSHGAVPADWAWWAGEASGVLEAGDDGDLYEVAFEDVVAKLGSAGITVEGLPSE
jgi:hypothetical protein